MMRAHSRSFVSAVVAMTGLASCGSGGSLDAGGPGGAGGGRADASGADADVDVNGDPHLTCWQIVNTAGLDTGFEQCADGARRRRAAVECPASVTAATSPCRPDSGPADCTSDADCTMQPHGYCATAHELTAYCGCYYGCRQDSDCAAGSICDCGDFIGQCVPATCTTNADCGPGLDCRATFAATAGASCTDVNQTRPTSYACQTAADQCHGSKECSDAGASQGACLLDGARRACGQLCTVAP
jgi:hypothetical protein